MLHCASCEKPSTIMEKYESSIESKIYCSSFKSAYQTVSVWIVLSKRGRSILVETVGLFDRHPYRVIINNHNHYCMTYMMVQLHSFYKKVTVNYTGLRILLCIWQTKKLSAWNDRRRARTWIPLKMYGVWWKCIYASAQCVFLILWTCFIFSTKYGIVYLTPISKASVSMPNRIRSVRAVKDWYTKYW